LLETGHFVEFDLKDQEFETFTSLARMSIQDSRFCSTTDYEETIWKPSRAITNHQENTNTKKMKTDNLKIIKLAPIKDSSPIAAIDVSILSLGETNQGLLYAIRGTVVSTKKREYRYSRLGPLLFHIKMENRSTTIGEMTDQYPSILLERENRAVNMYRRLLTVFENILKMRVAKRYRNAILLWDGSLTISSDEGTATINSLMRMARDRGNSVIGISKESYLLSPQEYANIREYQEPCLIDIDPTVEEMRRFLRLGNIYLARLSRTGLYFRLDIDKKLLEKQRVTATEKMIGNDLTQDGYPETLRLAHILSKFNATEVIGIQRFLDENCGLRIHAYPNIRRILFGPFSGSRNKEQDFAYAKPL